MLFFFCLWNKLNYKYLLSFLFCRLTNLNSLHRTIHSQIKDKNCGEVKESKQSSNEPVKRNISNESLQNPVKEEPCDELSPSEDEKDDFEDNFTAPVSIDCN